jgi:hypothetical protein
MLAALFIILVILWAFGYVRIEGLVFPDIVLFTLNGQPITLWSILILIVVAWAVGILPSPIRQIVAVLLIIWILAVLGILSITGIPLASIIVIAMIIGLIIALLSPRDVV